MLDAAPSSPRNQILALTQAARSFACQQTFPVYRDGVASRRMQCSKGRVMGSMACV